MHQLAVEPPQSRPALQPTHHHAAPNTLASFGPWLAIWILGGNDTYRLAGVVALAASVVLIGWELLSGVRPKLLDWGSLVIFGGICAMTLTQSASFSDHWLQPVANGALFALMAGSVLLGHPFAEDNARQSVPREAWSSPVFRQTVFGISVVWSLALLAMFVGTLVTAFAPRTEDYSTWVVTVVALVLASKFQAKYPAYVRSHA
jgi:hypothetical protein